MKSDASSKIRLQSIVKGGRVQDRKTKEGQKKKVKKINHKKNNLRQSKDLLEHLSFGALLVFVCYLFHEYFHALLCLFWGQLLIRCAYFNSINSILYFSSCDHHESMYAKSLGSQHF